MWLGLIFAGMGLIFVSIGIALIVQQRYRVATYQPVDAKVMSTSISRHAGGRQSTTYAPEIFYTYTVNGHRYSSRRVMPGGETSASYSWAQGVINQHRPGTKTTAWVSPTDPSQAFLIHQLDGAPYIFALLPAIFLVVGIALAITSHRANRPVKPLVSGGQGRFIVAEAGTIRGRFRTLLAATLTWYAYCSLLLLDYIHVNGLDLFGSLALATCFALGLFGVRFTYRNWQQAHDFLDAELTIAQQRICPGDTIQFRIRQGVLQAVQIDKLSAAVVCVRDYRVNYGNKTSYKTDVEWSQCVDFALNRMYQPARELEIEGELPIAEHVEPSSPHRGWKYPRHRWYIEVQVYPQSVRPLVVRYPIVVAQSATTQASGAGEASAAV
jgi:hypothetical protein